MFVVYGYKEGDENGFEDGSSHAWGPFNRESEAQNFIDNAEGDWDLQLLPLNSQDGFSWR